MNNTDKNSNNLEYENLVQAIVKQAVKDYKEDLKLFWAGEADEETLAAINEVISFFKSGWYAMLTDIDSKLIMRRAEEEAKKEYQDK